LLLFRHYVSKGRIFAPVLGINSLMEFSTQKTGMTFKSPISTIQN